MAYIYKITNKINGKSYIGQTSKTIQERYDVHIKCAKKHINRYLYDAMNHYGYDNFEVVCVEECVKELLDEREIYWIDKLHTLSPNGYNMTKGGGGGNTWELNPNKDLTSMKLQIANRGKKRSPEFCQTLSIKFKGRYVSSEQGRVASETKKNNIAKERGWGSWEERVKYIELCKKLFRKYELNENGGKIGFHHSYESKKKMSMSKKNKSYEEIYSPDEALRQKEYARKRWAKENNPNYISVDKDILLDKILNGEKLDAITTYFNCSRVTIFNKCEEYFGTTKTREVRKQYAK